jgi:hypothetical protein
VHCQFQTKALLGLRWSPIKCNLFCPTCKF